MYNLIKIKYLALIFALGVSAVYLIFVPKKSSPQMMPDIIAMNEDTLIAKGEEKHGGGGHHGGGHRGHAHRGHHGHNHHGNHGHNHRAHHWNHWHHGWWHHGAHPWGLKHGWYGNGWHFWNHWNLWHHPWHDWYWFGAKSLQGWGADPIHYYEPQYYYYGMAPSVTIWEHMGSLPGYWYDPNWYYFLSEPTVEYEYDEPAETSGIPIP